MSSINTISEKIKGKASKIKVVVTDVDGVLTSGEIIYDNTGLELKMFHVRDGQIMKALRETGFITGVITGRNSDVVKFRCRELGFNFHEHGVTDKLKVLDSKLKELNITRNQVAYIGDDLGDIKLMKNVGLSACPVDAPPYVREYADLILFAKGGRGCFRELAEILLSVNGYWDTVLKEYLE